MRAQHIALLVCGLTLHVSELAVASEVRISEPCPARWWVSVPTRTSIALSNKKLTRTLDTLHAEFSRISESVSPVYRTYANHYFRGNIYKLREPRGLVVGLRVEFNDRGIMISPVLSIQCEITDSADALRKDFISASEQDAVKAEMSAFIEQWRAREALSALRFTLKYF